MELAYKELTREVTLAMDSIIHIKLLCQVLPWLHQGSPFLARSRQYWSQVPASSVPAQPSPVLPEGTCSWGPPSVFEGSSASGSTGTCRAKCQTTRVPATRGHWGKGLFTMRGEGKDKESNRKGFKTLRPRRKM